MVFFFFFWGQFWPIMNMLSEGQDSSVFIKPDNNPEKSQQRIRGACYLWSRKIKFVHLKWNGEFILPLFSWKGYRLRKSTMLHTQTPMKNIIFDGAVVNIN